jgi:predicted Zn-dependent protease
MGLLLYAVVCLFCGGAFAQGTQSQDVIMLLSKAHALEVRGRVDMAKQSWQQVLLVDPNNAEALAGMARASKAEGNTADYQSYMDKLKAVHPNDPNLKQPDAAAAPAGQQDKTAQLAEAGRLSKQGQYARAMTILRQVYGDKPPVGETAVYYYETEAATDDGRPHAIAGLRELMDKYPQEARYQIALGKILTYNPRTREEGRKLLQAHPNNPEAAEALRQSLLWDAQNPATSADIRSYLATHHDAQLSTALAATTAQQAKAAQQAKRVPPKAPVMTPEQKAAQAQAATRSAEERAAYAALNAHHNEEAEQRFKAILAQQPQDWQALAGLGYIRMSQTNFGGAVSFFEQAKQDGAKDAAMEKSLEDSRFYYTMQQATIALNNNDLVKAQQQFNAAVRMRPGDATALLGLGGTLLKAQQPDAAIPVYVEYVKLKPDEPAAWRGLFMAQYGAGHFNEALATDKRIPAKVRAQLLHDPDYLRTLASVDSATGHDAEAQRVLADALNLPFPNGGVGLKTGVQLQYAALLAAANHREQAASLYRQVVAAEPNNVTAWIGLLQTEHTLGRDQNAFLELQTMSNQAYTQAMQEPGFETTVAAIEESQGHDDLAQDVLEKLLAKQTAEGRKQFVAAQLQLAGIYMRRGNPEKAFPLYESALQSNPRNASVWNGLLGALHANGHDQEALAEAQQIPQDIRLELEKDPAYLQTIGSIYAGLGQPQEAILFLNRAEQHYADEHVIPPADMEVQTAWLLYNSHADAALYQQLMMVGGRTDLSDTQRLTLQTVWVNFAVRRANEFSARGDYNRAVAILKATEKTFPGNRTVINALAGGYAGAGMPKEAVAIFRAEDLTHAEAADYKAAVGAALAANDMKDAETWLRYGLDLYPRDPQMLVLAAKYEAAEGDPQRAAEYYRAALKAMPANDAGTTLANELSRAPATMAAPLPNSRQPQGLSDLLAPANGSVLANGVQQPATIQPYLPSYMSPNTAPVPLLAPQYQPPTTVPAPAPAKSTTLKDYVPKTQLEGAPAPGLRSEAVPILVAQEQMAQMRELHQTAQSVAEHGAYRSFLPGEAGSEAEAEALISGRLGAQAEVVTRAGRGGVKFEQARFMPGEAQQQQMTTPDGTPIVPFASVARQNEQNQSQPPQKPSGQITQPATRPMSQQQSTTRRRVSPATNHPATATLTPQQRAAQIRANQADAPTAMTGVSHPPQDDLSVQGGARVSNAQYSPAPMQQTGDSGGQQYPQPRRGAASTAPATQRRRTSTPASTTTDVVPEQTVQQAPPMQYPLATQPVAVEGYQIATPQTPGQAPTDYELMHQNVPPLKAYLPPGEEPKPLSPRQQIELSAAQLEGMFSGWAGGSILGRYRSGTPGVDRLAMLEAPFEASVVIGQGLRLTIIPTAVFLNSGQLVTTGNAGDVTPVLGTLPLGAVYAPTEQFANGIGGEFQFATNTFNGAIGYTPYEFLVSNVIGRLRWKPANGHFTFYGGRDAVTETQLSYAGLRDPGQQTATQGGPVWGGVVQTGGGVRYDMGNAHAGLYMAGEGGYLTGYHVLDNNKYDGTMGAYFRVKSWPEYGTLTVGGVFYGEHFAHNERGETYGLGGYFSPEAYFLGAVPVSFTGHHGTDLHYSINGSVGVQSFQEDNQIYFPLDQSLQNTFVASNCTTAQQIATRTCGQMPVNSSTGLNFSFDTEVSYRVTEHWIVGGFLSANNTNNYDTVQGGFFGRYLFKPQYPTADYPTGMFPVESTTFRPFKVP